MLDLNYVKTLNLIYWSYYRTVKLTPIVLDDYLMLILTVPLVDQLLHQRPPMVMADHG